MRLRAGTVWIEVKEDRLDQALNFTVDSQNKREQIVVLGHGKVKKDKKVVCKKMVRPTPQNCGEGWVNRFEHMDKVTTGYNFNKSKEPNQFETIGTYVFAYC